MLEKAFQEQTF